MIAADLNIIEPHVVLHVKDFVGEIGGGGKDYEKLFNKPQINGVTLEGNKTLEELGIAPIDNVIIQGIL